MSYRYWLLPSPTLLVPPGVYTPSALSLGGDRFLFLILVIVLLLYVHLCIQPPAEIGFICLTDVSIPLPGCPQHSPRNLSLDSTLPDSIYVVVFTLIALAFFSPFPSSPLLSLSSPPLSSFWFSLTIAACIYLVPISIQHPSVASRTVTASCYIPISSVG